jgi:ferric-dicitrate binding protein FerR (iron transport regulator)
VTVEQTNELEERRVIRLLADLADDVPALAEEEIQRALQAASAPAPIVSGRLRSRRPARSFPAMAAAAVVALAFLVQFGAPAEHSSSSASGSASIVTFPEGNALQLLLSTRETR